MHQRLVKACILVFLTLSGLLCRSMEGASPPIPRPLYVESESGHYFLEVLPTFESAQVSEVRYALVRKNLLVIVYQRHQYNIPEDETSFVLWKEIGFFRAPHPNVNQDGEDSLEAAFLSNDGEFIILQAWENPMALHDRDVIFVYNRNGILIASYSPMDLYEVADFQGYGGTFRAVSIQLDNEKRQLILESSIRKRRKIFDLETGKAVMK